MRVLKDPHTLRAIMDKRLHVLEVTGVLLSGGAWLCSLATTLMSTWLTFSTELLATERYELGLWETCVVQDQGVLECQPFKGMLGLPPVIKLARILMCVTLALGLLGFLLVIRGMQLVNSCHSRVERHCHKRTVKTAGAVLCLAAGVLGLIPVSHMAHLAVVRYFDESVPEVVPRWELGGALFYGWTAGVLHLLAGMLLLTSCLCVQKEDQNTLVPPVPLVRLHPGRPAVRIRSEHI